jgi:hypothetical protein
MPLVPLVPFIVSGSACRDARSPPPVGGIEPCWVGPGRPHLRALAGARTRPGRGGRSRRRCCRPPAGCRRGRAPAVRTRSPASTSGEPRRSQRHERPDDRRWRVAAPDQPAAIPVHERPERPGIPARTRHAPDLPTGAAAPISMGQVGRETMPTATEAPPAPGAPTCRLLRGGLRSLSRRGEEARDWGRWRNSRERLAGNRRSVGGVLHGPKGAGRRCFRREHI